MSTYHIHDNPEDDWDWCHLYTGRWFGFWSYKNCFGWELSLGPVNIHRSYGME